MSRSSRPNRFATPWRGGPTACAAVVAGGALSPWRTPGGRRWRRPLPTRPRRAASATPPGRNPPAASCFASSGLSRVSHASHSFAVGRTPGPFATRSRATSAARVAASGLPSPARRSACTAATNSAPSAAERESGECRRGRTDGAGVRGAKPDKELLAVADRRASREQRDKRVCQVAAIPQLRQHRADFGVGQRAQQFDRRRASTRTRCRFDARRSRRAAADRSTPSSLANRTCSGRPNRGERINPAASPGDVRIRADVASPTRSGQWRSRVWPAFVTLRSRSSRVVGDPVEFVRGKRRREPSEDDQVMDVVERVGLVGQPARDPASRRGVRVAEGGQGPTQLAVQVAVSAREEAPQGVGRTGRRLFRRRLAKGVPLERPADCGAGGQVAERELDRPHRVQLGRRAGIGRERVEGRVECRARHWSGHGGPGPRGERDQRPLSVPRGM